MNDTDQAILDASWGAHCWDDPMSGLLPPGMRCSAYWYSLQLGLPLDIDSLKLLGLVAWRLAQREGLASWQVREGPYWVHMWPERIWDDAAAQLAVPRDHGYWEAGDYG